MARLKDLDEFFDDTLTLTIRGVDYVVPPADAETGLFCHQVWVTGLAAANGKDADATFLDDASEKDLYKRVLGPVYDQMIGDGVDWRRIKHAGMTAFLWITNDLDTATRYWESGGATQGEAEAPNPGAAATTTKRPASGSGTSPTRKPASTARRSPGKTS